MLLIGLAVTVGVVALAVFAIRKVVKWIKDGNPGQGKKMYLDQQTGAPVADIQSVLKSYSHASTVGSRARSAMAQVTSASEKRRNLETIIDGKFGKTSLTFTKFMSAVDVAYDVLVRNCTTVANRIQSFDLQDYRSLERSQMTSKWKGSTSLASTAQIQRLDLMKANISEMDAIISSNEGLLLEMDKLSVSLMNVGQHEAEHKTTGILEELQTLTEQARLYE